MERIDNLSYNGFIRKTYSNKFIDISTLIDWVIVYIKMQVNLLCIV